MFFNKKNNSHTGTSLLIDIRNDYISLSVLNITKDYTHIVGNKKYPASVNLLESSNLGKHLEGTISDFVHDALPKLASQKNSKIIEVNVVLSAPWYKPKMANILFKKESPVLFTKEIYNTLIAKEEALNQDDKTTIERNVSHILLNNYELNDPFNKQASSVDIAFYTSHVDVDIQSIIKDTIQKHLPKKKVSIHSSAFISFQAIRSSFVNVSSFLFFDINNDVTEIGIVKNNVFDTVVTIPFGKKHLLDSISAECKLDKVQTTSSLKMIANGSMDDTCNINMLQIIQKESEAWAAELGSVIGQIGERAIFPNKIFLLADSDIEPFALMTLKAEAIQKKIFNTNSVDVILLEKDHVSDQVKNDSNIPNLLDSIIIIKSLFFKNFKS